MYSLCLLYFSKLIVSTFTSSKSWVHLRKQFIVFSPVSTNDQGFVQHMELVWKRFFSLGISRWFWSRSSDIIHKQFSSGCDFACFYYYKYSIVCSGRWPIVSFVQKSSKVSFTLSLYGEFCCCTFVVKNCHSFSYLLHFAVMSGGKMYF